MGIVEIISLGISSVIMIIVSKTRLHLKNRCMSCSYNEHNIDLSKFDDEKTDDEDIPVDSFMTLPPPPPPPRYSKPLPVTHDLRKLNNLNNLGSVI